MRRSHDEIKELVAARVSDFVAGDASEHVLAASLKALGLDQSDVALELYKAWAERGRQGNPIPTWRRRL